MTAHVPNYELRCRLLTGGMLAVAIVAAWLCMVGFWVVGGYVAILLIVAVVGISSQWAFWRPRISGGRPRILMLHSVNERIMEPIAPNNSIRPAELESLIAGLLCAGYVFRTLRDAMEQPGRRVVVLTFDDGFEDNFTQLLPILKRFEVPATLFVTDRRGEDFLSDNQIRNLAASGLIEIGGHTVSHASLTELDEQTLDFVALIAGASGIITDSFHGLQFSSLFRRRISIFLGRDRTGISATSRFYDFCSRYGVSEACKDINRIYDSPEVGFVDLSRLNWALFSEDRNSSLDRLKQMLITR